MPASTKWYDDNKNIIIMSFSDPWTIEDMNEQVRLCHHMMKSVRHTTHLIMDASETKRLPNNLITNFLTRREMTTVPDNQGTVIVVATDAFLIYFVSLTKRVLQRYSRNMLILTSMEEAVAELHAVK